MSKRHKNIGSQDILVLHRRRHIDVYAITWIESFCEVIGEPVRNEMGTWNFSIAAGVSTAVELLVCIRF